MSCHDLPAGSTLKTSFTAGNSARLVPSSRRIKKDVREETPIYLSDPCIPSHYADVETTARRQCWMDRLAKTCRDTAATLARL